MECSGTSTPSRATAVPESENSNATNVSMVFGVFVDSDDAVRPECACFIDKTLVRREVRSVPRFFDPGCS